MILTRDEYQELDEFLTENSGTDLAVYAVRAWEYYGGFEKSSGHIDRLGALALRQARRAVTGIRYGMKRAGNSAGSFLFARTTTKSNFLIMYGMR